MPKGRVQTYIDAPLVDEPELTPQQHRAIEALLTARSYADAVRAQHGPSPQIAETRPEPDTSGQDRAPTDRPAATAASATSPSAPGAHRAEKPPKRGRDARLPHGADRHATGHDREARFVSGDQ